MSQKVHEFSHPPTQPRNLTYGLLKATHTKILSVNLQFRFTLTHMSAQDSKTEFQLDGHLSPAGGTDTRGKIDIHTPKQTDIHGVTYGGFA